MNVLKDTTPISVRMKLSCMCQQLLKDQAEEVCVCVCVCVWVGVGGCGCRWVWVGVYINNYSTLAYFV